MPRTSIPAALVLLAALPLHAQSNPATAPSPDALLQKLSVPATRDWALEQLKKLPAVTIVPLFEAVTDDSHPKKIRDDIAAAIDAIAARERSIAAAAEARTLEAWTMDTGVKFYEKSNAGAKWDLPVHEGFISYEHGDNASALNSFNVAIKAGCPDPLVHFDRDYCALRAPGADRKRAFADLEKSLQDLDGSDYADSRKCSAESSFAVLALTNDAKGLVPETAAVSALRNGIAHFKALADDHPGRAQLRLIASNLYAADGRVQGHTKGDCKEVVDAISTALPADSLSYFFKANFYTEWAWEARGAGFADSVTDDGWKLFRDRLAQARQIADAGWRLNPLDPDCPTVMIQVCMGEGAQRSEMESWFSRAVLADPHNFLACMAKEQFLLPKWGGTEQDALEFGRFCVAHGDAHDRIPTILLQVYKDLTELSSNISAITASPEYWSDVQSVYDKLLADKSRLQTHREQYLADRANYIKAACDSQHWKQAAALMDEFGDQISIARASADRRFMTMTARRRRAPPVRDPINAAADLRCCSVDARGHSPQALWPPGLLRSIFSRRTQK